MSEPQDEMEHQREQLAGKAGRAAVPGHQAGPLPGADAPLPGDEPGEDAVQSAGAAEPGKIEPRAGRDS